MPVPDCLLGKVAVITGTGSGQGEAAACRFAQEGALVVGCDIAVDGAEETLRIVKAAGGRMVSLHPMRSQRSRAVGGACGDGRGLLWRH